MAARYNVHYFEQSLVDADLALNHGFGQMVWNDNQDSQNSPKCNIGAYSWNGKDGKMVYRVDGKINSSVM